MLDFLMIKINNNILIKTTIMMILIVRFSKMKINKLMEQEIWLIQILTKDFLI